MNLTGRVLFCACMLLFVGCGGREYTGDERFPLTGKITYDGELLDRGSVSFIPQGSSKAQRVSGGEISDGAFNVSEAMGANAGSYRVEIRWAKKTGKRFYASDMGIWDEERKEGLPARFHKNSELIVEVSPEKHHFDFELKSK